MISLLDQVPYFSKHCSLYDLHAEEDKYLSKHLKAAKKEEALKNLSKYCHYQHYTAGSAIVHHGDPADKFFFILQGDVRRYGLRAFDDVQNEIKVRSNPNLKTKTTLEEPLNAKNDVKSGRPSYNSQNDISTGAPSMRTMTDGDQGGLNSSLDMDMSIDQHAHNQRAYTMSLPEDIVVFKNFKMDKKYFLSGVLTMKLCRNYTKGDYIGELSLAFNMAHSDTLVAWTDVHLVAIDKKHFENIFEALIKQNKEKLDFVAELLPGLPQNEIIMFAYGFEQIYYRTPTCIFQEGAPVDGLYLIKEGEIEVFKTVRPNTPPTTLPLLKTNERFQKVSLLLLSKGHFLGDEALLKTETRSLTAITKTYNTVVYFIPKKHLYKMAFYDLAIMRHLKSVAKARIEAYTQLLGQAMKQNKFKKAYINHSVERVIIEEKGQYTDAINELTEQAIQAEKEALKPSNAVRVRQPKADISLISEDPYEIQKLVELKKRSSSFRLHIDPELIKEERARTMQELPSSPIPEETLETLKKVPKAVVYREAPKFVYPFSLWENARSKYLPKKHKEVLKNHINEIAKASISKASSDPQRREKPNMKITLTPIEALINKVDHLKNLKLQNVDLNHLVKGNLKKADEKIFNEQTSPDTDTPQRKGVSPYLLGCLNKALNSKNKGEAITPIHIQGIMSLPDISVKDTEPVNKFFLTGQEEDIFKPQKKEEKKSMKQELKEMVPVKETEEENKVLDDQERYKGLHIGGDVEAKPRYLPRLKAKKGADDAYTRDDDKTKEKESGF